MALREHVGNCVRDGQKDIWIKGHYRLSSEAIDRLGDPVAGWRGLSQKSLLLLPSGYRLVGDGPSESSLTVEGNASVTLISVVDASSVSVEGLRLRGNSRETATSFPGAIHLLATPAAAHDVSGFRFADLQLENFRNGAWCGVENLGAHRISGVSVHRNTALSEPGNLRGPDKIGADNDVWAFCGNVLNPAGVVSDVEVADLVVKGEWLKCAVSFWSCVNTARVNRLLATDIGKHAADDSASYAVKIYSNHWYVNGPELWRDRRFFPENITVANSTVLEARSAGVYFASAGRVIVRDSFFRGQNDRNNQTEPRGCIAGPGCVDLVCEGNAIENAFAGIDWFPSVGNESSALIRNNYITGIRDRGIGIKARTSLDRNRNGRVHIADNYSSGTEPDCRGLLIHYTDEYRFAELHVTSNILRGDYADAEVLYHGTEDPAEFAGNTYLTGNFKRTDMATWHK